MKKISAIIIIVITVFCAAMFFAPAVSSEEASLSIKEYLEGALPPQEGRKMVYNDTTRLLTITDTRSNHDLIRKLVKQFEIGPKQIMIESRFVEVDVTDLSELGINWDFYQRGSQTQNKVFKGITVGTSTIQEYKGIHWNDSTTVTFPKAGNLAGQFLISHVTTTGDFLTANLRALVQQGKVNLLSSPKVTTVSGQMANIQVVRTIPYVSDFTLENIGTAQFPLWTYKLTLAEKPIGIFLEVTPYVTEGSNTITLDLHPEVSILLSQVPISTLTTSGQTGNLGNVTAVGGTVAIIPNNLGWPVIDVRTTQTSIAIDSGETIILGGMIKDNETISKKKVPLLGDVPLLGKLFQYDYKNQRKKNLLIFITASIINAEGGVIK